MGRGRLRGVKTTRHIGIVALLLAGCGPSVPSDTDTSDEGSSSASRGTDSAATNNGPDTADEVTSEGGSSDGGSAPDVDLGPCAVVSACLTSQDVPTDDPLARYGPGGTCWEEFPEPTCWAQCTALLESFSTNNCETEAPACCVCETDLQCTHDPANPTCSGGACTPGGAVDCSTVSFAEHVQPILTDNCVECHSLGGVWQSLNMTENAYDELVDVDGIQTMALADYKLVVPGEPELSYILYKLEGSQAEVAGAAAGKQMPLDRPPLAQDLQDTIRTWIECGAPL